MNSEATFFMPPAISTYAGDVDQAYYWIYYLSVFLFVAMVGAMFYFVIKYRRKNSLEIPSGPQHSTVLELTWTILPFFLVMAIFLLGFKGYLKMAIAPSNATEIHVTGRQWSWLFTYGNGVESTDQVLHVPKDHPIKMIMTSEDVIHSFYVPAFRIKHDLIPGQYSSLWFEAKEVGKFDLFCAEYCGTSHSNMLGKIEVMEPKAFETWLEHEHEEQNKAVAPEVLGQRLYTKFACVTCHTTDGSPRVGPSFKGAYGRTEKFTDGTSGVVNDNYIRESILQPQAKIVAGFQPVMPTFQGQLKDSDITALIAFIKSVK